MLSQISILLSFFLMSFSNGAPAVQERRFNKTEITWAITKYPPRQILSHQLVKDNVVESFKKWEQVTPLKFRQITNGSEADIKLFFVDPNHDTKCGTKFGDGVLAHTIYRIPTEIHFNSGISWSIGEDDADRIDLTTVILHNIGHALGLRHLNDREALMNAAYQGKRTTLTKMDIEAIQNLYGKQNIKRSVRQYTM